MKITYFLITILLFNSCGQDKVLQLPEISHSEISKINDVSAAYLFYDETKTDSVELNRRNLISSTNWLINVDKRLTINQVIPHIKFLQEKKRNSSHKKENSKNYFTCNNTSKKNLGFIEFTDVVYDDKESNVNFKNQNSHLEQVIKIKVHSLDSIKISFLWKDTIFLNTSNKNDLLEHLESNITNESNALIFSELRESLSFQDYISFKSLLLKLDLENVTISNYEFIFN